MACPAARREGDRRGGDDWLDAGDGQVIAVWVAEFNPIPEFSTGRFAKVVDGSFVGHDLNRGTSTFVKRPAIVVAASRTAGFRTIGARSSCSARAEISDRKVTLGLHGNLGYITGDSVFFERFYGGGLGS